ncbi:MAG TPA: LLM class F420-dependent oxidoreductase [Actinomycetota bacterium]|jgi:F420-dependent oxidoreductase-like protein|nr:LLM class F420-dependent oxidoreductase [Actinomycetota bacterium]
MKLGMQVGYSGAGMEDHVASAKLADELDFHSIWTAEAYGSDAISPLVWMGAHTSKVKLATGIMQMPARTPAMTAMTAATIDALTGGRFICGLGLSGPQVVEGWHGQPYGKPLLKTREYVEILRAIWRREKPLEFSGEHYQIPYAGPKATGLGKPLKSILHPRPDIPIIIAAIGPKNIALSAEISDGFIPAFFNPYRSDVFTEPMNEGFARRSSDLRPSSEFDLVATCAVIETHDVQGALGFVKPMLALYIGGMGARGRNFYNDLACRYGFEAAAKEIQDLYLDGKKAEAMAAVPDELADAISLVGPRERIRDRFAAWQESPCTVMLLGGGNRATFELMAELAG